MTPTWGQIKRILLEQGYQPEQIMIIKKTKTMDNQIQELIGRLGINTYCCGACIDKNYPKIKLPIRLCDVLEKVKEKYGIGLGTLSKYHTVVEMWEVCGFTKPLQQIAKMKEEVKITPEAEDSGYGGQCTCFQSAPCSFCENTIYEEQLTKEAKSLFQFLIDIGL